MQAGGEKLSKKFQKTAKIPSNPLDLLNRGLYNKARLFSDGKQLKFYRRVHS